MRIRTLVGLLSVLVLTTAGAAAAPAASGRTTVMGADSLWRCFVVRGSELARKKSGELCHLYEFGGGRSMKSLAQSEVPVASYTALPPTEWRSADFDDGAWTRARGPFYAFTRNKWGLVGSYLPISLVCLRGRFQVDDPARVKDLRLSLEFEGGAVVYLNGKELTRSHMPKGELKPETPAEDYPDKASVAPDGFLLRKRYGDLKKYPELFKLRTRRISELNIPGSALRKGVNILAIELHRAPGNEAMFTGKAKRVHPRSTWWSRIGLVNVALTSPVAIKSTRPAKLTIWNQQVIERVTTADRGDPNEKLRPIVIKGVRNGAFSGKVLVGSNAAIKQGNCI